MQNLITLIADPADNLVSTLTPIHSLEYQWDFFSPLTQHNDSVYQENTFLFWGTRSKAMII